LRVPFRGGGPDPDCVIGVYDSLRLNDQCIYGFWDTSQSISKELWVRVDLDPPEISGLTGIELSISGLPAGPIAPVEEWFPTPASVSGLDIRTPNDTTGTAQGGKVITWDHCLADTPILGKITVFSVAPIGNDRIIRVLPRFPLSTPSLPFPLIKQCDAPNYTPTVVTGQCYILYPSSYPSCGVYRGCLISVSCCLAAGPKTWSGIKNLYR